MDLANNIDHIYIFARIMPTSRIWTFFLWKEQKLTDFVRNFGELCVRVWVLLIRLVEQSFCVFSRILNRFIFAASVIHAATNTVARVTFSVVTFGITAAYTAAAIVDRDKCHIYPTSANSQPA